MKKFVTMNGQTIGKIFMASNLTPNISVIKKEFDKNNKFENKDYGFVVLIKVNILVNV